MRTSLVAALSLSIAGAAARADVITIGAAQDNTLYEDFQGSRSNGSGRYMFAGSTAGWAYRRALVAFDIADSIPPGSTILSASLTLHMSRSISGNEAVSLHRVLADWGEGASRAPGEEGEGAPSQPGDATWIHTFYDSQFWAAPGGDFEGAHSASILVGPSVGFYTWSSNVALIADVQGWLDDPGQSFGWIVIGNESTYTTAKRFDTRENGNANYRPMLTIEYVPIPAPGGCLLLMAGAIGLGARRRAGRR